MRIIGLLIFLWIIYLIAQIIILGLKRELHIVAKTNYHDMDLAQRIAFQPLILMIRLLTKVIYGVMGLIK